MESRRQMAEKLKNLPAMRLQVETIDKAMQVLTPEERLLVEQMVIHRTKGNLQQLCQILELEKSAVYWRKDKALDKLIQALGMDS